MKKAARRRPFQGAAPALRGLGRLPAGAGRFLRHGLHGLLDGALATLLGLAGEVPGEEGEQRYAQQDQAGDRVDLRLHAQAHGGEHFHRQCGRARSGDEAGQHQVVERQKKGERLI